MGTFTLDFKKTPLFNLIGLVNANNNKDYKPEDVNVLAPVAIPDVGDGRNTKVQIDLLIQPSDVDGDFVEFSYGRIPLEVIFANIDSGDVDNMNTSVVINEDGSLNVDNVKSEMLRMYGFYVDEENYTFTLINPYLLTISTKDINLVYLGSFDIDLSSIYGEEATKVVEDFKDTPLDSTPTENSLTQRDISGDVVAKYFRSTVENTDTFSGAIGFQGENGMEFCSDEKKVKEKLSISTITIGKEPTNPSVNDIWIGD